MQTVMKRMRKMGLGGMMGMMKNVVGSHDAEMLAQSMDPEALARDMAESGEASSPLGDNPFLKGGNPFGGGMTGLGGNPFGGLGGFPQQGRGGSPKNRSKNKKGKR
jgi:hypothetical protein